MPALTPLHPSGDVPLIDRKADIVAIPGYGAPQPSEWGGGTSLWLKQLVDDNNSSIQIWAYHYEFDTGGKPWLQQIQQGAHELVTSLKEFCRSNSQEGLQRPLIFICHSLGGLLLKKALCVMIEHNLEHLDVLNLISGICFISTPHLPRPYASDFSILDLMVRANTNNFPSKNAVNQNDNDAIAIVCQDFRASISSIPILTVPILTFCEGIDTKLQYKRIFAKLLHKARMVRIVPKALSAIGVHGEKGPVEVAKPHDQTCNIAVQDLAFTEISAHLTQILKDAPGLIDAKFMIRMPTGVAGTLRTISERAETWTMAPTVSADAQNNSAFHESNLSPGLATAGSTDRSYVKIADIEAPTNFEEVKKDPKLPCFSAPSQRTKDFFGRQDIVVRIDAAFFPDQTLKEDTETMLGEGEKIRSFALCGMGGIGKTSMALHYAHLRKDRFDAIFWVKADERNNLALEFARIATDLGLMDKVDANDLQAAVQTVKDWLFRPVRTYTAPDDNLNKDASWFLIFDNVDDFETLIEFWPGACAGSVLITSRDPLAKSQVYTVNDGIDLDLFSHSESMQLVQNMTQSLSQRGQDIALDEVATLLGGLPGLIIPMTGVMNRLRLSYSDFLRLVENSGLEKIEAGNGSDLSKDRYYSILSAVGFEKLTEEAVSMLQVMAYLDPDNIPEKILDARGLTDTINPRFPSDPAQYFGARSQLVQSSLIYHNEAKQTLNLHRIVQTIAGQKLNKQGQVRSLKTALVLVSKTWPFQSLQARFNTQRYDRCAEIFGHVLRIRSAYEDLMKSPGHDLTASVQAAALFNDAGWYWFERGYPQESKAFFKLAQSICEASPERHTKNVSYMLRETHNNQGSAAAETNDHEECLKHNEMWLQLALERRDENGMEIADYELGSVYNEVGVAYAMNRRYDEAIKSFFRSVEIYQSLPDYTDLMLGWPLPNLGFMYWVRGRYVEAEETLQEIREIREAAYKRDDVEDFKVGKILYALGNVYTSMEDYLKGYEYHERAMRQWCTTLGKENHRVGDVCHRLADHCLRRGDHQAAKQYIAEAIRIFGIRPYLRQELSRSIFKEAQILAASGSREDAEKTFRKAYEIRQELCPNDTRHVSEVTEKDYDQLVIFWSR